MWRGHLGNLRLARCECCVSNYQQCRASSNSSKTCKYPMVRTVLYMSNMVNKFHVRCIYLGVPDGGVISAPRNVGSLGPINKHLMLLYRKKSSEPRQGSSLTTLVFLLLSYWSSIAVLPCTGTLTTFSSYTALRRPSIHASVFDLPSCRDLSEGSQNGEIALHGIW